LSILAFFVITHGFTTLGFIRAVPFWNSAIMPVLSLASGLWLGSQIAIGLALGADQIQIPVILEPVARWFIFSYVLLTLFHFWTAWQGSLGSRKSIQLLIKGDLAPLFYLGVVLVALICLIITIYFCVKPVDTAFSLMWIRIFCAVIGDVAFRYCIFKAARYVPLINSNISGARFT
jgi:formate-dependent nitrite reductase membrane component NrfD